MEYYTKTLNYANQLLGEAHEVTKTMKQSCGNAIESLKKIKEESRSSIGAALANKDPLSAKRKKEIKVKYEQYKKEISNDIIPYAIESDTKKDVYGYKDLQKLVRLMTPRQPSKKKEH